jgi:CDGSH-type Zn-finger protein
MPARIAVNHDGSLRVEGEFEILDPMGKPFGLADRGAIWLGRCGQSASQPFCDGSHGRVGFSDPVEARDPPPPQPRP